MKKKGYSVDRGGYVVDDVYERPYTDTAEERLSIFADRHIKHYRIKTIKSGSILECEIYPIWDTRAAFGRAPKTKVSRGAQKRLNHKNSVKQFVRLLNANFTAADIWGSFTYDDAHLPSTPAAAEKEMANYARRLRYAAEKRGFPELKFAWTTQFNDDPKCKIRVHHHLVTNFPDRDLAETLWHGGGRTQTRRLQPDKYGLEGMARYILRNNTGYKSYRTSRNLKKPVVTIADYKITRRKVRQLLQQEVPAAAVFAQMYRGYDFLDMSAFTSEYVGGAYIHARMRC